MSFEGFVCWNSGLVDSVMNTEALQTDDAVFLATHHPVRMYRQSLKRVDTKQEYDQKRFLEDFMGQKSFAFVPVLGTAGTGKSHLIRWLALNIPEAPNRRIILIPKGGTNLRDIIFRILQGMPGAQFDDYRARLSRATSGLTDSKARELLLNNLAVAVGANGGGVRAKEVQNVDRDQKEAYQHLEAYLPALLYDTLFREHLLRDGGIIADLVRHTLGTSEVRERREARQQFSIADLPLSVHDVQRAGAAARQLYADLVSDPWMQEVAVEWMNLHLDEALGQLLQLSGDDLTRLMRDVRAELGEQGVELILLIEDFARLQGIERQLLEAVMEQPNQPDQPRPLCALRTALACTTDYFKGVAATVRDRPTFVVSLDREALGGSALVTEEDFAQFAARYLNAIRLREGELEAWHARYLEGGGREAAPNACERCPYQSTCHAAFGAADGRGLYPFNRTALLEMYDRVREKEFSPRLLINDVLKHTVKDYGGGIPEGRFPSPALRDSFGESRLTGETRRKIELRDRIHADRREVLIEFWAGRRLVDLDPALQRAFLLPEIKFGEIEEPPEGPGGEEGGGDEQEPPEIPRKLEDNLAMLDRWQNGAELPQGLTAELRGAVYEAVYNRVDWDAEMLVRGAFAGSAKPFRPTSVYFQNQETQPGSTLIRLTVPVDGGSLTDASIALQGLLLYRNYGHWNFTHGLGGPYYFRTYARLLEQWSAAVLEQIRRGYLADEAWDPLPAGVEVLAIGARLLGEPSSGPTLVENQIAALFAPPKGVEEVPRGPLWRGLVQTFLREREFIIELVTSRAAATKGGSQAVQVLDAAQIVGPLRAVQDGWIPTQPLPASLPNTREYQALRRLATQFSEGLAAAIDEERTRALQRFARVAEALISEEGIKEVIPALRAAVERARAEGVYAGPQVEDLERAVTALQKAPLVRWETSVKAVQEEDVDRDVLLLELSQSHEAAAGAAEEFVALAERFLTGSTERVRREVEQLEAAGGRDLEACQRQIEEHVQQFGDLLAGLGGAAPVGDVPLSGGPA